MPGTPVAITSPAVSRAAEETAAPSRNAALRPLVSTVYGYVTEVPGDLLVSTAQRTWDGGDIDHTADYVDRATDAETVDLFVLGTPSADSLAQAADSHLAWLSDARGCAEASSRSDTTLGGDPAIVAVADCPEGVFGPTTVSKVLTIHEGLLVIVTAFSPDDGSAAMPTALTTALSTWSWTR